MSLVHPLYSKKNLHRGFPWDTISTVDENWVQKASQTEEKRTKWYELGTPLLVDQN